MHTASKSRYKEKLRLISGCDHYELKLNEWHDCIKLWLAITHVHVWMYLILTPSPYTEKDTLNYKSLDSYQNFVNSQVRCLLVKQVAVDVRQGVLEVN